MRASKPGSAARRRQPMTASLHPISIAFIALAAVVATTPVRALQLVEASDGVAVEAILSIKEPTRIRIENAPITDVFGNILSSNCGNNSVLPTAPGTSPVGGSAPATNPTGELVLECDRDKGEIYIRPAGDSLKPINLFISSANATYTLLLRRSDTPADTIVIRDKTLKAHQTAPATAQPAGAAPSHIRTIKALLLAMAADRVPTDISVEDIHRSVQLWTETRFTLMRRFEGRGLVGETYLLQNISSGPMVLAEQEFDRPNSQTGGDVAAVAIEHHNLRPGESTAVYVIRREASP